MCPSGTDLVYLNSVYLFFLINTKHYFGSGWEVSFELLFRLLHRLFEYHDFTTISFISKYWFMKDLCFHFELLFFLFNLIVCCFLFSQLCVVGLALIHSWVFCVHLKVQNLYSLGKCLFLHLIAEGKNILLWFYSKIIMLEFLAIWAWHCNFHLPSMND